MENIETAILLMVVGMATVFVILLIVIFPLPCVTTFTAAVMAAKMFPGTGAGPCDASRFTGTTSSGAYLLTNVINNLPK